MVSGKRNREEMECTEPTVEPSLLDQVRNMWEFANIMQYIYIFGKAVKIDEDLDIEDLETECLKPGPSEKLAQIGLALLKVVSSHRGLTPEIFDEYTRRQYEAKAPSRSPFGNEDVPKSFADFDIFTKLRVLQQLSQWTLINSDRIRERMPETKESEQAGWRMEELGYDSQDRVYFALDDDRLYRRTDPRHPSPPAPKPKSNSKKGKAIARASKRRKVSGITSEQEQFGEVEQTTAAFKTEEAEDGFGGRKWECIAITLEQYKGFLETIRKSRNPAEKILHQTITKDILHIIEGREEEQQRKAARREKEILNAQKLATAKRSSRIASKLDQQKEQEEAAEAERKRKADLVMARKEQERQKKMEEARESRMMTREQRLKDREYKRLLHEEELANLSEDSKKLETGEARMSERHLKAEMEKRKKELERLAEEDTWVFDCAVCGVHGDNLDDGSHSVACENCNVWQHSSCLGISQEAAERDDFHFICKDCERRIEDAKKPKIPALKFRLGSSSSPPADKAVAPNGHSSNKRPHEENVPLSPSPKKVKRSENAQSMTSTTAKVHQSPNGYPKPSPNVMNGPSLSPLGQSPGPPRLQNGNGPYIPFQPSGSTQLSSPSHIASPTAPRYGLQGPINSPPGISPAKNSVPPSAPTEPSSTTPSLSASVSSRPQETQAPPSNPFLNSFNRQQPSPSPTKHAYPSPTKANHPTAFPMQGNKDIVGRLAIPETGSPNGYHKHTRPAQSVSVPHSSPTTNHQASPSLFQPSSPSAIPSSTSGVSPTKQSPPRPPSSHGVTAAAVAATPAVLPPVASLSPSPRPQNLSPPTKVFTFEQTTINGQ
ncbi:MAG: hypothetical protein M1827_003312 [Pycnora praestabilis]|nr:MAG: hypothetical protein M1827_003312 [Pycnora praestabilis]